MATTHLVTRYNEFTNDLHIIGVSHLRSGCLNIINQDFAKNGQIIVTKTMGSYRPATLQFTDAGARVSCPNEGLATVQKRVLSYTITELPNDTLLSVGQF